MENDRPPGSSCELPAGEDETLRRRHALAIAGHFEAAHARRYDGSIGAMELFAQLAVDFDNAQEAIAWARAHGEKLAVLRIAPMLVRALASFSGSSQTFGLAELLDEWTTPDLPPDGLLRADGVRWEDAELEPGRVAQLLIINPLGIELVRA